MIKEIEGSGETFFAEPPLVIPAGTFSGTSTELAKLILKQIENHPQNFSMSSWIDAPEEDVACDPALEGELERLASRKPEMCGTTLCIAGYAQLFADGEINNDVQNRATELLGITKEDSMEFFFIGQERAVNALAILADEGVEPFQRYLMDRYLW